MRNSIPVLIRSVYSIGSIKNKYDLGYATTFTNSSLLSLIELSPPFHILMIVGGFLSFNSVRALILWKQFIAHRRVVVKAWKKPFQGPVHRTLGTSLWKHINRRLFWICVWGKLGQGNHVIIVTSSFSKCSFVKMFSVQPRSQGVSSHRPWGER